VRNHDRPDIDDAELLRMKTVRIERAYQRMLIGAAYA
jgi:hypothetical protein